MKAKLQASVDELFARVNPVEIRATSLSIQIRRAILAWLESTSTTQKDLAEAAKISPEHVTRLLTKNNNLRISTIAALECAMGESLIEVQERYPLSYSLTVTPADQDDNNSPSAMVAFSSASFTYTLKESEGIELSGEHLVYIPTNREAA